jgi:GTP-binding protein HflX
MNRRRSSPSEPVLERAALVHLATKSARSTDADLILDELAGLARAAGATVVLRLTQERRSPDPATFIGKGKAESLAAACSEVGADLVIVDNELSPAQTRNLEAAVGRRVIDRTALILDIFARRARTREGRLQVERAQLEYLLPRLAGSSEALSRLGGGIGTRGPGETKLETDRRRIRERLSKLKAEIAEVGKRRQSLRARRQRRDVPTVAIVGYTNAGKSTLFNLLTGAEADASHALFVTLDPLVRRLVLPDARQIMLSDTVGFIDRLPHQLVAAFRATLEEVAAADLLLHVVDASEPDRQRRIDAVASVLADVGAAAIPTRMVFNKIDKLDAQELEGLRAAWPDAVFVSARKPAGKSAVQRAIVHGLDMDVEPIRVDLDPRLTEDRALMEDLYRHARVIRHDTVDGRATIDALVPRKLLARFRRAKVPA